ncbi:MAG: bifunctional diaminohydroxyphosphoribosylaminopyrimidine deaminase/5-amino-6-(5-phosphoribosylamino)uracil reductase RibD, partial [Acidobacteriota bacterium]
FVNLEPCSHHGRTPPCAEALIEAGVARVVVAIEDPSLHAAGSGIARLRERGIGVGVGLLEDRAAHLNEVFLHSVRCGRPFVLLKAAMSLDGKLSTITGQSQWITSEQSRRSSLELREEYDSILVGAGTVAADNPRLTRRQGLNTAVAGWTRIVLDGRATLEAGAEVLTDGDPTLLYTARAEFWKERRQSAEVVSIHSNEGRVDLDEVLEDLARRGVRSVIVEGGSAVLSEFIVRQLWQKMILFVAPIFAGGSSENAIFSSAPLKRLEDALRFRFVESKPAGPDLMITAYPGSSGVDERNSEPRRLG